MPYAHAEAMTPTKVVFSAPFMGDISKVTSCTASRWALGILEAQPALQAYPNPANQWIEIPEMEVGASYVIVGLNGRLYEEGELQGGHRISTNELADGVYVINFQTGTSVTSLKVVVSH